MSFYPAREIVRGLWVGSEGDSVNPRFMKRKRIGLIVNASRGIPMSFPGIPSYRIPVDDDPRCNRSMLRHWPVVVRAIDAALRGGHGVLVHCRAGMQRSAATAAAYLMWKRGMTAEAAMRFMKKRKKETFYPVPTFDRALQRWEDQLRAQGRIG